jgi:hypothetical protein
MARSLQFREAFTENFSTSRIREMTIMKTTTTTTGLKVKSAIKAGGLPYSNHTRSGLKVRSAIKAGAVRLADNHNRCPLQ